MAQTVTADLTITLNATDTETSYTVAAGGDVTQLQETSTTYPTVAKSWSSDLTLNSTPTTLDLTALTGPRGAVSFATIRLAYFRVITLTAGYSVIVGAAAGTLFNGPMGGTAPTTTIPPGSRLIWENEDTAGWTVSGSYKSLKLDPGANVVVLRVILIGS